MLKHDMFRPLLGHHQVYFLCLGTELDLYFVEIATPDDDTIRVKTCRVLRF
jgi:hypothetical protein